MTGSKIIITFTETEYLVAKRQQLGLGFEGIAGGDQIGNYCGCKPGNPVLLDDAEVDQHISTGCHWGNGYRTQAHTKVLNVLETLVQAAAIPHRKEEIITLPELRGMLGTTEKRMDLVIEEPDLNKTMYIDVTRTNTLAKSNQGLLVTDDAVKLRRRAYNEMKKDKYGRYHAEAEYSGALLFPFCLDANGSFIPTDRLFNPGVDNRQAPLGKGLAPQAGLRAVFEDGKAPQVGQLEISVEEGMIQKLSRRVVADASVGGCKLLDATLSEDAATGLLVNQTYALIAANCILLSAQAAVQTIRRNVQRNTRFHL